MKAKYKSNFEYGKKLATYLVVFAVVLMLVGLFMTEEGTVTQTAVMVLIAATIIATFAVIYHYCRCPYCGKHIFFGALRVTVCPACKRNLVNGKKAKKNER